MKVAHEWTEHSARIQVEGLEDAVRVLHVTDSHLGLIDERDSAYLAGNQVYRDKFSKRRLDAQGRPIHTEDSLAEIVRTSKDWKLDLIAHTGDLVHFPSKASVETAARILESAGTPWLYTPGNHDWRFPQLTGGDEVREAWWPALQPLHKGTAAFGSCEIKGVRFVAIDDSNYQISASQLAFAGEQLAGGKPTIFLLHIPLSLPSLRPQTLEVWKDPILIADPDWPQERRKRWLSRDNDPETLEFARLLAKAENLIAVLCGHIHFHHADKVGESSMQYVGLPGYAGGYRLLELVPLAAVEA